MIKIKFRYSGLVLVYYLFAFFPVSPAVAAGFDDSVSTGLKLPAWFSKDPFNDLSRVLQNARSEGKQGLLIVFGTVGCSYCEVFLRKSLGDPSLASTVKRNFKTVYLEIFDDTDMITPDGQSMSIKNYAKQEGVQFTPTLLFYGTDGKRILRVIGYQSPERFRTILGYVNGAHYKTVSLRDYFKCQAQQRPEKFNTGSLIQDAMFRSPPYNLQPGAIAGNRPLLVIFVKAGCRECVDFHEKVLDLTSVREGLMDFNVVRLDAADNTTPVRDPDGKLTTPTAWYESTNFARLPALVFFNERGEKVLETDALVIRQRMLNSIGYVLERAYEKNWTYQRFARAKGIEKISGSRWNNP